MVLSFPGPDRSIRLEDLRTGRAVSRRYRNRRIGEFLKELDLTEGRSTGVRKILKAMKTNGSPVPIFDTDEDRSYFLVRLPVHPLAGGQERQETGEATPQVTPQVLQLLEACEGELTREELQARTGLEAREHFRTTHLRPAIEAGLIEMTIPDKPRSSRQRYRLTPLGHSVLERR